MTTKFFSKESTVNVDAPPPSTTNALTLAYRTFGDAKNPAVFIPTCYCGRLPNTMTFLYEPDKDGKAPPVLANYFVITCGLLGGSESSSPSNTPAAIRGPKFPSASYEDNIRMQVALCKALGVERLHAYIGFSMGGQQAYHMGVLYPEFVERIVVVAGSARTSWHNWSFLEGPKAALTTAVDWHDGHYTAPVKRGTAAFGRVYATWALSQAWFRGKQWEAAGCASLEEYLVKHWEQPMQTWDAHDLLAIMDTWQRGDVSACFPEDKGDLATTLGRVQAKALIMPVRTDLYFPPEDSEEEVKHLKHGKLCVIESIGGHMTGGGGIYEKDNAFMSEQIKNWLEN